MSAALLQRILDELGTQRQLLEAILARLTPVRHATNGDKCPEILPDSCPNCAETPENQP